jgi:sucrose-6-phosphate hydrolase SacC (GH32 family)
VAIYPTAWSGSAIVDKDNLSGLKDPASKHDLILAYYSHIGHGECLAYSNDGGLTFTHAGDEFQVNHLPGHSGRDPKIIWYEPTKSWIIAVYDTDKESGDGIAIFSSKNCKNWKFESKFKGAYECPELFELAVDGDKNNKKWVIYGASGYYYIGTFDGHRFISDYETGFEFSHNRIFYASQTWNNVPESDGRRIQIAWGRYKPTGAQWNKQMLFPVELTLRTTGDGPRMFANPVREIESLYKDKVYKWENVKLEQGKDVSFDVNEEFLDMTFVLKVSDDVVVSLNLHGNGLSYGKNEKALIVPRNGRIKVRILKDSTSIETYAFDGAVYIPLGSTTPPDRRELVFSLESGTCKIESFEAHGLNSAWKDRPPRLDFNSDVGEITDRVDLSPNRTEAKEKVK